MIHSGTVYVIVRYTTHYVRLVDNVKKVIELDAWNRDSLAAYPGQFFLGGLFGAFDGILSALLCICGCCVAYIHKVFYTCNV